MTLDAFFVFTGLLIFVIGFPVWAYVSTGKLWTGALMFAACAFLVFMALR